MWEAWTSGKFFNNFRKDMDGAIDNIMNRKFNYAHNIQSNTDFLLDKNSNKSKPNNKRYSKTSYTKSRQKLKEFTTKKPKSSK